MRSYIGWWIIGAVPITLWSGDPYVGAGSGLLVMFLACQIWRTRPCSGRCGGKGRLGDPLSPQTYWRPCPDCGGSGRQLRLLALRREGD